MGARELKTRKVVIDELLMEGRSLVHLHALEAALGRPTHPKRKHKQPLPSAGKELLK